MGGPRNGCYTTSPQVKSARVRDRWQRYCGGRGEPGQVGKRVEAVEFDTVNLKTDWWLQCVFCIHETVEDSLYSFCWSWICRKDAWQWYHDTGEIELWAVCWTIGWMPFFSLNNWCNVYCSPVSSFFFGAQRTVPSTISDRARKHVKLQPWESEPNAWKDTYLRVYKYTQDM